MLVGIDVGGTKTHVVAEQHGTTLLDVVHPTLQWQVGGLLGDHGNVRRLLGLVPGLAADAAIAVGAHGLDSDRQVAEFAERLRRHHAGPTVAVNDVELLVPAAGFRSGIAVVAGTGSKVVGHDAGGAVVASGGWGFLVSDPGSAPALVLAASRAVLLAHDEGLPADPLGELLTAHFGAPDAPGLAEVFVNGLDVHGWAAAAPAVFAAADAGSALAEGVVRDAARGLADDVRRVLQRGAVGEHVVCAGGVIANQSRLLDDLRAALADVDPGLEVVLLEVPPVRGALELARSLAAVGIRSA